MNLVVGKDACQPVVVLCRDRVVFVVMAAGATNGQSEHSFTSCRDDVIQLVPLYAVPTLIGYKGTGGNESGQSNRKEVIWGVFVPRQLPFDELVVGDVLVESLDDGIPVTVCIGAIIVGLISMAFTKSGQIQPMTSPPFTEMIAVEQAVDLLTIGIGILVHEEGFHLIRGWRQAQQSKGDST